MNVGIELPEDIARQLRSAWGDMPRRALEAVALEGYRSGALSRGQVGRLLGLNFFETEAFLKEKQPYLPYASPINRLTMIGREALCESLSCSHS